MYESIAIPGLSGTVERYLVRIGERSNWKIALKELCKILREIKKILHSKKCISNRCSSRTKELLSIERRLFKVVVKIVTVHCRVKKHLSIGFTSRFYRRAMGIKCPGHRYKNNIIFIYYYYFVKLYDDKCMFHNLSTMDCDCLFGYCKIDYTFHSLLLFYCLLTILQ